jgi:hypothetical protein
LVVLVAHEGTKPETLSEVQRMQFDAMRRIIDNSGARSRWQCNSRTWLYEWRP